MPGPQLYGNPSKLCLSRDDKSCTGRAGSTADSGPSREDAIIGFKGLDIACRPHALRATCSGEVVGGGRRRLTRGTHFDTPHGVSCRSTAIDAAVNAAQTKQKGRTHLQESFAGAELRSEASVDGNALWGRVDGRKASRGGSMNVKSLISSSD